MGVGISMASQRNFFMDCNALADCLYHGARADKDIKERPAFWVRIMYGYNVLLILIHVGYFKISRGFI